MSKCTHLDAEILQKTSFVQGWTANIGADTKASYPQVYSSEAKRLLGGEFLSKRK